MKQRSKIAQPIVRYEVTIDEGLNAQQVNERKEHNLTNKVNKVVGKSYASIFLGNIFTFFNMLGLTIMILIFALGSYGNLFFSVVILSNTFIGIIQEIKAKRSIEKLSLLSAPIAKVVREGKECDIAVGDVVLDDVLQLETGKQIIADAIIMSGTIEVNEALLTGESAAIKKTVGDILLSGSFVVSGSCHAKVERIGVDNYVEKLSLQAKKYKKPNSQLMKSINAIVKAIAIVIIPLGIATYFTSFSKIGNVSDTLLRAAGSMLGMIPSGMVLLTSVTLAVSVIKLAKNKALAQDLYCIEMLARVNVLCLDKTGTITDGTMTVQHVQMLDPDFVNLDIAMSKLLLATGDGNQSALAMSNYFGKSSDSVAMATIPFSSARKFSAASFEDCGTVVVGAPSFVMNITEQTKAQVKEYTAQGKRVLLVAVSDDKIVDEKLPSTLREVALIVIEDTIRQDAIETIEWFKQNEVAVKVISGDDPLAVSVIAGRVGIKNFEQYINLDGLSEDEVVDAARKYTVFGRVSPDQKATLVKAIKAAGNTVAMTGDGVNDILAMKEADCAVAIAAGSEAARSVAHLVLMDSKFSSMPKVVREGRQVVNNIQNSSSLFLMKTTMTIFTTILMIILGQSYPFEPKNLYIIEFLVIGIPSFVLALRPNSALIKGKFIHNTLFKTIPSGLALSASVGIIYLYCALNNIATSNNPLVITLAAMAMTLSGVIALGVMCFPYNWTTAAVAIVSATLSALCFVIAPVAKFMEYVDIGKHFWIVLVCLAVAAIIIVGGRCIETALVKKNAKQETVALNLEEPL